MCPDIAFRPAVDLLGEDLYDLGADLSAPLRCELDAARRGDVRA